MLAVVFFVTTVICGIGWLTYWVGAAALAKYLMDKGYKPPSDEEMKACTMYVWKKIFHLK